MRALSLSISRTLDRPAYLQLSDQLIHLIHRGHLAAGTQLPPSRRLAEQLGVNRKTIMAAYEDVLHQGYLISRVGSGIYVSEQLPLRPDYPTGISMEKRASFAFDRSVSPPEATPPDTLLRLTEGAPDVRLANLDLLYGEVKRLLQRPIGHRLCRYGDGRGDEKLRMALATYLRGSRGIPVHRDRLLICRGSQHGMQLAARLLFRRGGLLAAASLSYDPILAVAKDYGADVLSIPLDEEGIDVESLAAHPKLSEVRAVYVTPHHQYPTTVTLSAERRLRLLDLAALHGFAIIEDDYDYDFHYGSGPQLPLAALDQQGSVIYLGSFSKILAPTLRVGYLLAPTEFIHAALRQRLLTDRQGDLLLERALAHYIAEGELDRHLRKVRKVYQSRRDHFHTLLEEQLGQAVALRLPEGGMATWAKISPKTDFEQLSAACLSEGILLSPSPPSWRDEGGLRLGFAALNEEEQQQTIQVLASALWQQHQA